MNEMTLDKIIVNKMSVDEMPMDKTSCHHNLFKISFETVDDFKNKLNKANFKRSFLKGKKIF
jgi:hypothetical protein